jgi:hypothetical protein
VQVCDIVKGADPTTHIRISGVDDREAVKGEMTRVMSRRVGRVRKRLLPQLDVEF